MALALVAAVVVAVLALPQGAAAQIPTDPTPGRVFLSPPTGPAGTAGNWSITVSGDTWYASRGVNVYWQGQQVAQTVSSPSGTFSVGISPPRGPAGTYRVDVESLYCNGTCSWRRGAATFTAVNPTVQLSPPCSRPLTSQTLTVTGDTWDPQFPIYVHYDYPSNTVQTVSAPGGSFTASFTVTPPDRDVVIFVEQPRIGASVRRVWSPCPPAPTTTTSTTAPPTTPRPTTTTTRPGTTPTVPTTTTSTTIPIPPPGVTLVIEPALGPPGFVALARGTGWAPGPVQILWSPGVGAFSATAGPDGSFVQQVLVFPRDSIGPRSLLATNGAQSAAAPFLVVPQTVQPAGKDVTTINRIRRFLQRSG